MTASRQLFFVLLFLALGAGSGFFSCPALAAKTEEQLRQVRQQLNRQQQEQDSIDKKAKETGTELQTLRQRLIKSAAQLQDKEEEADALAGKLDNLADDITNRNRTETEDKAELSALALALIELDYRPPASLLFQTGLTVDYIRQSILLRAALPRLNEQAAMAAADLIELRKIKTKMLEQQRLVSDAEQNLERQRRDLDQLIALRQNLLQKTEAQKTEAARHIAALANEAEDLQQLMERLNAARSKRLKGGDATNGAGGAAILWPVAGSIARHFGDRDEDGVTASGVTFTALSGAPVVAPRAGQVVFRGPFRGYGQIVILRHEGGYHSFLAGFGRIDTDMGEDVDAGEPIGVLPVKPGARPKLYFEWRKDNKAENPEGSARRQGH